MTYTGMHSCSKAVLPISSSRSYFIHFSSKKVNKSACRTWWKSYFFFPLFLWILLNAFGMYIFAKQSLIGLPRWIRMCSFTTKSRVIFFKSSYWQPNGVKVKFFLAVVSSLWAGLFLVILSAETTRPRCVLRRALPLYRL